MTERRWGIRLSAAAERDFATILRWTTEAFGVRQAEIYRDVIAGALSSLTEGPDVLGSKPRDEILPGLRTLHVRRPGRHFVVCRASVGNTIEIVRILHDAMDLARQITPEDPGSEASPAER